MNKGLISKSLKLSTNGIFNFRKLQINVINPFQNKPFIKNIYSLNRHSGIPAVRVDFFNFNCLKIWLNGLF